ncbi:ACT domain-containing protein [Mesorhizobium sp.]|uniref:ACT domain-containing protein n=1 Tax=Mesorhizobium sp. TaxID=1871066 RepID=UPI0025F67E40|nr:ACT domain-containing protein [Mesorhizobium sp.]
MAGETDLRKLLLATMTPELRPGVHLFAPLPPDAPVPDSLQPVMLFREQQEWYAGKGCASVDRCSRSPRHVEEAVDHAFSAGLSRSIMMMAASTSSAGEDFAALHQPGQIQRVGLGIGSRKLSVISAMTLSVVLPYPNGARWQSLQTNCRSWRRPSPLPSPREKRGEGIAGVAAKPLLPSLYGEKVPAGG